MALAALFAVLAWWLGTGAVFLLDRRPRRTYPLSLAIGGLCALGALASLPWLAHQASVTAAYVGFCAALVVWGWHEMAFLMGLVTGPRKLPCPPEATGGPRFWAATATLLHHELALFATGALIVLLSWGGPNQVAAHTYGVLWVMRLSAKLNVFFGVKHLAVELIPERLEYLATYFGPKRTHPFLIVSIAASSIALGALTVRGLDVDAPFGAAGAGLVAALLGLAVLEHLFLALPVRDSWLWGWALRAADKR